uniref:Beta-lactamase-related domain-containing protein n=1 Tax=Chromera velia CCMP2878 TaxID=1169474 RepID=A0A0G4H282_9ALVE|eukprot:Cvel_24368.t1-p1 / transcript=Cvel_24368.t1 / gene=Cvel_24368 / organism=Chromera_velia_CCMP2878 / gene_product=Penicillin-binding protein 4, putative / transcript_product=Penicillin-binding protein 4, putative / location=Cvel_scaffold2624:2234-5564(+) / protein_length=697 / sequence_SO=supercontig / SO=protein_coding / is_pseudo=false
MRRVVPSVCIHLSLAVLLSSSSPNNTKAVAQFTSSPFSSPFIPSSPVGGSITINKPSCHGHYCLGLQGQSCSAACQQVGRSCSSVYPGRGRTNGNDAREMFDSVWQLGCTNTDFRGRTQLYHPAYVSSTATVMHRKCVGTDNVWYLSCSAFHSQMRRLCHCPMPGGHPDMCKVGTAFDGPCSVGQGDCDSSHECVSGTLTCGTNNGGSFGFSSATDVCVYPSWGERYWTVREGWRFGLRGRSCSEACGSTNIASRHITDGAYWALQNLFSPSFEACKRDKIATWWAHDQPAVVTDMTDPHGNYGRCLGFAGSQMPSSGVLTTSKYPTVQRFCRCLTNDLSSQAQAVLNANSLVAAVAMARGDGRRLREFGYAGVRIRGQQNGGSVSADSRWHIGSMTKFWTSTLVGILLEEPSNAAFSWSSTLKALWDARGSSHHSGIFQTWASLRAASRYTTATLADFATHAAGMCSNQEPCGADPSVDMGTSSSSWHIRAVASCLKSSTGQSGSNIYSNHDFVVLGVAAELLAQTSYESAMLSRIFTPLGIQSGWWGSPQGSRDGWGHWGGAGTPQDPTSRPSPFHPMSPSGDLAASVDDIMRFYRWHLRGVLGYSSSSPRLSRGGFQSLHTPTTGSWAKGMFTGTWNGKDCIQHNGSIGSWLSLVWVCKGSGLGDSDVHLMISSTGGAPGNAAVNSMLSTLRGL